MRVVEVSRRPDETGHRGGPLRLARSIVLAAGTLVAACATGSSGASEPAATTRTGVVVQTPGSSDAFTLTRDANISTMTVPASPESLWPVLVTAYGDAGLDVSGADSDRRILVSSGSRVRRIAGDRVDRFFDCPGTAYGNTASSGDVYPLVRTELISASEGATVVRMQVEAVSVSNTGNRGQCRSTGRLERMLRDALVAGR